MGISAIHVSNPLGTVALKQSSIGLVTGTMCFSTALVALTRKKLSIHDGFGELQVPQALFELQALAGEVCNQRCDSVRLILSQGRRFYAHYDVLSQGPTDFWPRQPSNMERIILAFFGSLGQCFSPGPVSPVLRVLGPVGHSKQVAK